MQKKEGKNSRDEMKIPFIVENTVLFECRSGKLCVGDLINEPAVYNVPISGIYHIPAEAIKVASDFEEGAFSIDNAQFFLIDAEYYQSIKEEILAHGNIVPDIDFFGEIRRRYNIAFGYIVCGDLYDCDFSGDGTYRIDHQMAKHGLPIPLKDETLNTKEQLRRIVSKMNTLVCAKCFSTEIQSHPELGGSPFGKGKKRKEWAIAMAEYAITQGWTATPQKGSFGDINPLCPKCRLAEQK